MITHIVQHAVLDHSLPAVMRVLDQYAGKVDPETNGFAIQSDILESGI